MDDLAWSVVGLVVMAGLIAGIVWLCPRSRAISEEDRRQARFFLAKAYDQYRVEVPKEDYRQQLLEHKGWPTTVTLTDMSNYTDLIDKLERTAGVMDFTEVCDWIDTAGPSDEAKWGQLFIWMNEVKLRAYIGQAVNRIAAEAPEPTEAIQRFRQHLHLSSSGGVA